MYVKKRIRMDRLLIVIAGALAILLIMFLLLRMLFSVFTSVDYTKTDESVKLANEEIVREMDDETIQRIYYYPKFNEAFIDDAVKQIVDEWKNIDADESVKVLKGDYTSEIIADQYLSMTFSFARYNQEDELIDSSFKTLNADLLAKEVLELDDCLRVDYMDALHKQIKNELKYDVKEEELADFTIQEDGLHFMIADQSFVFEYKGNERYIALVNEEIPSWAPSPLPKRIERSFDPDKPMIAFTFDDGPAEGVTNRIVDLFNQYNGNATFFELGSRIEQFPHLTQYAYENGHEIANHSYSHIDLSYADKQAIKDEVYATQDAAFKLTGREIALLRPTYGNISDTLIDTIHMEMVNWNVDSLDWELRSMSKIVDEVLPYVQDGSIILMHDIYESTAEAVEYMLPILAQRGYQFVNVSYLLEHRN